MTDIRTLLITAAGDPPQGQMLAQVHRIANRRRRVRAVAMVGASLVIVAGVTGTALATSTHRAHPAVLAPASSGDLASPTQAPSSAEGKDPGNECQLSALTIGTPTPEDAPQGQSSIDQPITINHCNLRISDFGFTPDASVPVSLSPRPVTVVPPNAMAHLVLKGQSDGTCATLPEAHSIAVTYGGSAFTTITLPTGMCTQITVELDPPPKIP